MMAPTADGRLQGADGKPVSLETVGVVWVHQGDSSAQDGPLYAGAVTGVLQRFVEAGGGLFLSGAALSMVELLGVEPLQPRRGGPGDDRVRAGLVPVRKEHPVFGGLRLEGGVAWVSGSGYPAFSDFHGTDGPAGGMLLARTPSGVENPLVEYALGKGRIIAMGWRLPHFGNAKNADRANLERVTSNILGYLSDRSQWRKIVVHRPAAAGAVAAADEVADGEWSALEHALRDLTVTFGPRYPAGADYLERLQALRQRYDASAAVTAEGVEGRQRSRLELVAEFHALKREALLANPLLAFDSLLLVKRRAGRLGLPQNWQSNSSLPRTGFDNEIAVLSPVHPDGRLETLFRPERPVFVGDVDLDFSGDRLLFSMPAENGRWQVFESGRAGRPVTALPLITEPDVDNYDACYLPDGNVLFTSTAPFVGVPCVQGSSHVANLFRLERPTGAIRQLTFDQDHDWCPTVLGNGRVLYLRWEYSDIPHYVSRILFHMNPDGTGQMEYYGSNSYWPNAMFYARPIPGHASRFVAIVGGHHDVPRMGELVLFDTEKGRQEAGGVVQRIPGRGEAVEPLILDGLVGSSWPKFLHPWPLADPETGAGAGTYFLAAARPTSRSRWGIYLVDVFDNMVLVKEDPGYALLEPIPLRPRHRPPVIPPRSDPQRRDAVVFLSDVYRGPGLAGVPMGSVKRLRLISYHFAYHGMGGQVNRVGLDGPWDIKRIVGTVPVEPDGSACFRVPANTPISVQPLDAEGKALQVMRSWMTAMPGEVLSCVGCHEPQNSVPPSRVALAARKAPAEIKPWYGPERGFSFVREVQPVLDQHCVRCHDGSRRKGGGVRLDFRPADPVRPKGGSKSYNQGTKFSPSYLALRSYVRSPTIESDMHLLAPGEFHADTTALVRLLARGHHGVELEERDWDRIVTWIDLHTPAHGTWTEIVGAKAVNHQRDRRRAMMSRYAGRDGDPEAVSDVPPVAERARPERRTGLPVGPRSAGGSVLPLTGWPETAEEARTRQGSHTPCEREIDLGSGVALRLVWVPPGEFVMGDAGGSPGALPQVRQRVDRPFWLGKHEVTNEQFALFDPEHDSRIEHGDFLQFSVRERGYPVNLPSQPVVRVSWDRAMAFCRWLSEATGQSFTLPDEREWEYACRAGSGTALWYGEEDADFAKVANLADESLRKVDTFGWGLPSGAIPPWRPAIAAINDGHRVSAPVGSFEANAWGLHDMHGNAAEWTRSPYDVSVVSDGIDGTDVPQDVRMAVRGGSWYDRPRFARSGSRRAQRRYLGAFDVGFRVVCTSQVVNAGAPRAQR